MNISYEIEDRETIHAQLCMEGKRVAHENITDLDENGRPMNCFVIVEDAPTVEENDTADLLDAAAIMGLEPEGE